MSQVGTGALTHHRTPFILAQEMQSLRTVHPRDSRTPLAFLFRRCLNRHFVLEVLEVSCHGEESNDVHDMQDCRLY